MTTSTASAPAPRDCFTRFRITRRRLLNNPLPHRQARYATYDSLLVSAQPISVTEAWAIEQSMARGPALFPIAIQPLESESGEVAA